MTRLMTWKLSDPDVPQTSLRKIGMSRFNFSLIPRTWPGVLKMLKTGERARRMTAGIPDTCCPPRYADVEHRDSRVPVSNPDLLRYPYCGRRILAGRGSTSICIYTDDQIMAMVRLFPVSVGFWREGARTSSMYSQLFTQLQSQHESGSGSGCGAGEDDESGDDEDAGEDADS
ncbi:hypothetical protein Tco_0352270 [Tanacetum coccineum]